MGASGAFQAVAHLAQTAVGVSFAPDGRFFAYASDESGPYEIYVRPFPNIEEGLWQVSRDGGTQPLWAPNGRELFFASPRAN